MKDYIKIRLDRPRKLRYTPETFKKIPDKLGISSKAGGLVSEKMERLDLKYISVFLWAGLISEDPGLKSWQVQKLVEQCGKKQQKQIVRAIQKALIIYGNRVRQAIAQVDKIRGEIADASRFFE